MTLYQADVFPNPEILTPLPAKRVVSPSASALLSRAGGWGSECVECLGTRPRTTQGTAASRQARPCSGAGRPCPAGPTHARGVWGLPPERGRPHGRMIQGDSTCGEQRNLGRFSCGVWFSQSRRSQKFPGNFHRHRGTHRRCGSQPGRSVPGTPPLRRRRPQAPFRPRWRDRPPPASLGECHCSPSACGLCSLDPRL